MTDFISRRTSLRALARLAAGGAALNTLAAHAAHTAPLARQRNAAPSPIPDLPAPVLRLQTSVDDRAQQLATSLARHAPNLDPMALLLASQALDSALNQRGLLAQAPRTLTLIDYSLPSTQQRLWLFDLQDQRLLHEEWVAHGRNSGDNMTVRFSNQMDSRMSSLGAFVAANTYHGGNGYSLRLRGLEPGFNDRAFDRAIVVHGAAYVNENIIRSQGRLGRSWGCPAVRSDISRTLINRMADGGFLFGYYPDRDWLAHSRLIGGLARMQA